MVFNVIGYGLYYLFFDLWQNTILCSWANEKQSEIETITEIKDDIELQQQYDVIANPET